MMVEMALTLILEQGEFENIRRRWHTRFDTVVVRKDIGSTK